MLGNAPKWTNKPSSTALKQTFWNHQKKKFGQSGWGICSVLQYLAVQTAECAHGRKRRILHHDFPKHDLTCPSDTLQQCDKRQNQGKSDENEGKQRLQNLQHEKHYFLHEILPVQSVKRNNASCSKTHYFFLQIRLESMQFWGRRMCAMMPENIIFWRKFSNSRTSAVMSAQKTMPLMHATAKQINGKRS